MGAKKIYILNSDQHCPAYKLTDDSGTPDSSFWNELCFNNDDCIVLMYWKMTRVKENNQKELEKLYSSSIEVIKYFLDYKLKSNIF